VIDPEGKTVAYANVTVIEIKMGHKKYDMADESGKYKVVIDEYEIGDEIKIFATDGKRSERNISIIRGGGAMRVDIHFTQFFLPNFFNT
jgi:hypothetical protein